ncbi:hypothetical protein D0Z07_0959 [Hyphodiscus hymeniophilus]|uniref:Mediator of RNA polymerase II transcription subunit 18 n=1 Tax=Hyphodiscus hymeniophilus TaxID=353542 RepID=A0A9P7B0K4_9HELO|nr:hypothetical protein D0Z07_0959 [Hyphodiscus hymeniophilus]
MHELFLISHCSDEDVPKATKLLQGFCEMAPVSIINRRLIWEAPQVPKQRGLDPQFLMRQPQHRLPLWKALQDSLTRQAYYVNLVYGVSRDQFASVATDVRNEEGREREQLSLDDMPGSLYWVDWPDPKSSRPVNSRNAASMDNERGLCSLMRSMGYKLNKEIIEEGFRFIHGNVIIHIHRYFDTPSTVQEVVKATFSTALPSYESLIPFDSENKWIVKAQVDVLNANDQDHVQKGIDELLSVRDAFDGYFDFPVLERRMLDTRVRT